MTWPANSPNNHNRTEKTRGTWLRIDPWEVSIHQRMPVNFAVIRIKKICFELVKSMPKRIVGLIKGKAAKYKDYFWSMNFIFFSLIYGYSKIFYEAIIFSNWTKKCSAFHLFFFFFFSLLYTKGKEIKWTSSGWANSIFFAKFNSIKIYYKHLSIFTNFRTNW